MGKKQAIRSLANSIALISTHKLLVEHTNKPESIKHLKDEVADYSNDAFEKSREYNWTKEELEEIKAVSIKETKNRLKKYQDITIKESDIPEAVIDTMQELLLI
ncbi:MAG: hypothetical protein ABIH64_03950 [Nanoarchaeota archaeon]